MAKEIERKYLIDVIDFKKLNKVHPAVLIEQGYFVLHKKFHTRVRVSTAKNKSLASLTSKLGQGLSRDEFEEEISLVHARLILKHCIRVLRKQRLRVKYKGLTWDVDYYPDYELAVAEVEIPTVDFLISKPEWVGKEVTGSKKYSNIRLAKKQKIS